MFSRRSFLCLGRNLGGTRLYSLHGWCNANHARSRLETYSEIFAPVLPPALERQRADLASLRAWPASMRVKIPGWAQAVTRLGVVQVEHKCVLDSCRVLQGEGFEVTYLPVGKNGLLNVEDVRAAIRPDTVPPSPDRPAVNEL